MTTVLASWILVLLSTLAIALSVHVRTETRLQQRLSDQLRSEALAEAALAQAEILLWPIDQDALVTSFELTLPPAFAGSFPLARGWFALESPFADALTPSPPALEDEDRRLPLEHITREGLTALGVTDPGAQSELLAAREGTIAQWRVALATSGIDSTQQHLLERCVTPFPTTALNLNTAEIGALRAAGVPPSACDKIEHYRVGSDGVQATADDRGFTELTDPEGGLRALHLNSAEAAVLSLLVDRGVLGTTSSVYRLRGWGWLEEGPGVCQLDIVVARKNDRWIELHRERTWIH